ncbi:sensor histidine kinase [Clostridium sp. LP20]|uniref:sensor histidine kinase n=1 Tax=Clostridium sp. LP20 TaxID=3418665 RepID=UPI003EE5ABDF
MIISFFKDQVEFITIYFINFGLIILFYTLSTDHTIEIIYPFLISIFTLSVFLVFKGFGYFEFNRSLKRSSGKEVNILNEYTEEEKEVVRVIKEMERYYIDEISRIKNNNLKKNKFISQWIHNMKTPVSVIDLVVQRFKLGEIDIKDTIKGVYDENTRLFNNLEQVLDMLRLEDFSKDYISAETSLNELLKSVINEKKNQFIYNKVYPKIEIDSDVMILTDLKWSKVMLSQILSNAIKYSADENQKKMIYFTINKLGNVVILNIRDEGVGIQKYDIGRIFEPFFTGDNGRKFKDSSGIGLFIVKEICEKLNHKIEISSKYGTGTTVKIKYLSKL